MCLYEPDAMKGMSEQGRHVGADAPALALVPIQHEKMLPRGTVGALNGGDVPSKENKESVPLAFNIIAT